MNFTQIPSDAFQKIQMNAGVLVDTFEPSTATIGNIIAATSGGISFTATPEYSDFGEDIDNAPRNTKELKRQTDVAVSATGTFVTVDANIAKMLMGAADSSTVTGTTVTKLTPRMDLTDADFDDLWLVGDYSDENTGTNAGFIAIHMLNTLSTGGFSFTTADRSKGTFPFTFTAHYSIEQPDVVPYEIYIKQGTASA